MKQTKFCKTGFCTIHNYDRSDSCKNRLKVCSGSRVTFILLNNPFPMNFEVSLSYYEAKNQCQVSQKKYLVN